MTNPFDDFPGYSDWFVGSKALKWRKVHEAEILDTLSKLNSVREIAPEVIKVFRELEERGSLSAEYETIHQKVVGIMESLLEDMIEFGEVEIREEEPK